MRPNRGEDLVLQPAHQRVVARPAAVGQPVGQHAVSALGQDRLGMKLDAVDGQRSVPHRHDHTAVSVGDGLELGRQRLREDRQGVIPGRGEWIRKSLQYANIGVEDAAGLAVQ